MGQRYLTHESDDERWEKHRTEKNLPSWETYGHKSGKERQSDVLEAWGIYSGYIPHSQELLAGFQAQFAGEKESC